MPLPWELIFVFRTSSRNWPSFQEPTHHLEADFSSPTLMKNWQAALPFVRSMTAFVK